MRTDWEEVIPVAVHDLRALIRKGAGNAQLLERLLASQATPEVAGHLRAIKESLNDLNRFSSRLVALSESGRVSESTETVDLETAILGAKLECKEAIRLAGGADFDMQPLPDCQVATRIQTVIRELIDNSSRFRDLDRPLRIAIGAEAGEDTIRLRIADNGTGVPAEYREKLFHPLQRLDAARSGFGLGLAISEAIVRSSGGRIYSESGESGLSLVVELPVLAADA